jgi:hypothetical protein
MKEHHMWELARIKWPQLLSGLLLVLLSSSILAQPPETLTPEAEKERPLRELELPPGEIQVPKLDPLVPGSRESRVFEIFRDAVEGKIDATGTGNPIVDDMIGVMQTNGVVANRFPKDLLSESGESNRGLDVSTIDADQTVSQRAKAAEQLLRASRILEKVSGGSPVRVTLIREMRSEAKRLLSE